MEKLPTQHPGTVQTGAETSSGPGDDHQDNPSYIARGRENACAQDKDIGARGISPESCSYLSTKKTKKVEDEYIPCKKKFQNLDDALQYEAGFFLTIQEQIEAWKKKPSPNNCELISRHVQEYMVFSRYLCTDEHFTEQHLQSHCYKLNELLKKLPGDLKGAGSPAHIRTLEGLTFLLSHRKKAEAHFKQGFDSGDVESAFWLGMMVINSNPALAKDAFGYVVGSGVESVVSWLNIALDQCTSLSFGTLGWDLGTEMSGDNRRICECLAIDAAKNGEFTFLAQIADSYMNGTRGYPERKNVAFLYLEQAVESRNPVAQISKAFYLTGINYAPDWRVNYSQPLEAIDLFLRAGNRLREVDKEREVSEAVLIIQGGKIIYPDRMWIESIYQAACKLRVNGNALLANLMELFEIGCTGKKEHAIKLLQYEEQPENRFWLAVAIFLGLCDKPKSEAIIQAMTSYNAGFFPAATLVAYLWEKVEDRYESDTLACSQYASVQAARLGGVQSGFNYKAMAHCLLRLGMLEKAWEAYDIHPDVTVNLDPEGGFALLVARDHHASVDDIKIILPIGEGSYRGHMWKLRRELERSRQGEQVDKQFQEGMRSLLHTHEAKMLYLAVQACETRKNTVIRAKFCATFREAFRAVDLLESGYLTPGSGVTISWLVDILIDQMTDAECYLLRSDPGVDYVVSAIIAEIEADKSKCLHTKRKGYHLAACLSCDPRYHIMEANCFLAMQMPDAAVTTMSRAGNEYRAKTHSRVVKKYIDVGREYSPESDPDRIAWQKIGCQLNENYDRIKREAEKAGCRFPANLKPDEIIPRLKTILPSKDITNAYSEEQARKYLELLTPYIPVILFNHDFWPSLPEENRNLLGRYFYNLGVACCTLRRHPEAYTYLALAVKFDSEAACELAWKYCYCLQDMHGAIKNLNDSTWVLSELEIQDSFIREANCMWIAIHQWMKKQCSGYVESDGRQYIKPALQAIVLGSAYGYVIYAERFAYYFAHTRETDIDQLKTISIWQLYFTNSAVQMGSAMILKSMLNGFLSGEPHKYGINPWRLINALRSCQLPSLPPPGQRHRFPELTEDTDVRLLGTSNAISAESRELGSQLLHPDPESHAILSLWVKTGQLKKKQCGQQLSVTSEEKHLIAFLAGVKEGKKECVSELTKHLYEINTKRSLLAELAIVQLSVLGLVKPDASFLSRRKDILKKAEKAGYACAKTCRGMLERQLGNKQAAIKLYDKARSFDEFCFPDPDAIYLWVQLELAALGPDSGSEFVKIIQVWAKNELDRAVSMAHPGAAALFLRLSLNPGAFEKWTLPDDIYWTDNVPSICLINLWKKIKQSPADINITIMDALNVYSDSKDPLVLFYLLAMAEDLPGVKVNISFEKVLEKLVATMKQEHACWLIDHPDTPRIIEILLERASIKGANQAAIFNLVSLLQPDFKYPVATETKGQCSVKTKKISGAGKRGRKERLAESSRKVLLSEKDISGVELQQPVPVKKKMQNIPDPAPSGYIEQIKTGAIDYAPGYCEKLCRTCIKQGDYRQAVSWVLVPVECGMVGRRDCLIAALEKALYSESTAIDWVNTIISQMGDDKLAGDSAGKEILKRCGTRLIELCHSQESWWSRAESLYNFIRKHQFPLFENLSPDKLLEAINGCWDNAEFAADLYSALEKWDFTGVEYNDRFYEICELAVEHYLGENPVRYESAMRFVLAMEPARERKKTGANQAIMKIMIFALQKDAPDKKWLEQLYLNMTQHRQPCILPDNVVNNVVVLLDKTLDECSSFVNSGAADYLAHSLAQQPAIYSCTETCHIYKFCRTQESRDAFARLMVRSANLADDNKGEKIIAFEMLDELLASPERNSREGILEELDGQAEKSPLIVLRWLEEKETHFASLSKEWLESCDWCLKCSELSKSVNIADQDLKKDINKCCQELRGVSRLSKSQKKAIHKLNIRAAVWFGKSSEVTGLVDQLDRERRAVQLRKAIAGMMAGKPLPPRFPESLKNLDEDVLELLTQEHRQIISGLISGAELEEVMENRPQNLSAMKKEDLMREIDTLLQQLGKRELLKLGRLELSRISSELSIAMSKTEFKSLQKEIRHVCAAIKLAQYALGFHEIDNSTLWNEIFLRAHSGKPLKCSNSFLKVPWAAFDLCERLAKSALSAESWISALPQCQQTESRETLLAIWGMYGLDEKLTNEWSRKLQGAPQSLAEDNMPEVDASSGSCSGQTKEPITGDECLTTPGVDEEISAVEGAVSPDNHGAGEIAGEKADEKAGEKIVARQEWRGQMEDHPDDETSSSIWGENLPNVISYQCAKKREEAAAGIQGIQSNRIEYEIEEGLDNLQHLFDQPDFLFDQEGLKKECGRIVSLAENHYGRGYAQKIYEHFEILSLNRLIKQNASIGKHEEVVNIFGSLMLSCQGDFSRLPSKIKTELINSFSILRDRFENEMTPEAIAGINCIHKKMCQCQLLSQLSRRAEESHNQTIEDELQRLLDECDNLKSQYFDDAVFKKKVSSTIETITAKKNQLEKEMLVINLEILKGEIASEWFANDPVHFYKTLLVRYEKEKQSLSEPYQLVLKACEAVNWLIVHGKNLPDHSSYSSESVTLLTEMRDIKSNVPDELVAVLNKLLAIIDTTVIQTGNFDSDRILRNVKRELKKIISDSLLPGSLSLQTLY